MKVTEHNSNVKGMDSYNDSRNITYVRIHIGRIYRAFHNVLRNYKHLLQENRRTRIYQTCTYRRSNSKIFFPSKLFFIAVHISAARRVYVVRKWPLLGRSRFVCWNIMRVSLWLLCNVHFVQRTRLRDLADLKAQIIAAVKNIDAPMLTRMWQEL